MANQDDGPAPGPIPGADPGRLQGEEADNRRRTNPGPTGPGAGQRPGAGDPGGSGGSAGNRDIIEALLRAAMRARFGRGLTNSGFLAMGTLFFFLRRRRRAAEGAVVPDEHLERNERVVQAARHLARQADPRAAAADLPGVDVQRVRETQRTLRFEDVGAVLADHLRTARLEDAARDGAQARGADPTTAPEELWKRYRGDDLDPARLPPRDLAVHWLSAGMSVEPGARDAERTLADTLATQHPRLWQSIELGIAQDPNFRGDPHATRVDKPTALAGAIWQADSRPEDVATEQHWTRMVARFTDQRIGLDPHRDNAQLLLAAIHDGRTEATHLLTAVQNAERAIPGFRDAYPERLQHHREQATAEERAHGETARFPQGDAMLDTLDRLRGLPSAQPADRAAAVHAVNGHQDAILSRHTDGVAADPRAMTTDARRPMDVGDTRRGLDLAGTATARPDIPDHLRRGSEQRPDEITDGRQRAASQEQAHRRGERPTAPVVGREAAPLRVRDQLGRYREARRRLARDARVHVARRKQTRWERRGATR